MSNSPGSPPFQNSGLLPQIELRRLANQGWSPYDSTLSVHSCFQQSPQVPCQDSGDCVSWLLLNCDYQDQSKTVPMCNAGTCEFAFLPS